MSNTKKLEPPRLKPPRVGGAFPGGTGHTSTTAFFRPPFFTAQMLQELAVINAEFPHNGMPRTTLFGCLQQLEYFHSPDSDPDLYEGYYQQTWISELGAALTGRGLSSNTLESWVGKDAGELYKQFRAMQDYTPSDRLPINYMTYALNRMGQPSLPRGKMGWVHLQPFQIK